MKVTEETIDALDPIVRQVGLVIVKAIKEKFTGAEMSSMFILCAAQLMGDVLKQSASFGGEAEELAGQHVSQMWNFQQVPFVIVPKEVAGYLADLIETEQVPTGEVRD